MMKSRMNYIVLIFFSFFFIFLSSIGLDYKLLLVAKFSLSIWLLLLVHHHHHLSLNREGHWGTTDKFPNSFLLFSLFSAFLCDLANSRPVHSLMLSSHLFLCLHCHLSPFTVPCKMVLARPDEWETSQCHCSLCLFTMIRRSSIGLIACLILAWTSSLVTWSSYEMCNISW